MLMEKDTSPKPHPVKKETNTLRLIFHNLLISFFLISTYFIISENFGSISRLFILNSGFVLEFGITLFIFTFFAILAGPFHAAVAGFIGEYLYQMAYYNEIYIYWCSIIAIFGLINGVYKYKPLKYHKGTNVYYTFLLIIISSFTAMFIIVLFQNFYNSNNLDLDTILINYGFKFLLQTIVSVLFFVPLLLVLYDKLLAGKERHVYIELLTHHPESESDHTLILTFGRTHVYFCTRCSGFVIGALFSMFLTRLVIVIYKIPEVSPELAILFCIIMPIPGLLDWGTQRLGFRKSTSRTRLFTGFIIGIALHYISFTRKYYFVLLFLLILYFTIFFMLMYFGQKREMKKFEAEMDKLRNKPNFENIDIEDD